MEIVNVTLSCRLTFAELSSRHRFFGRGIKEKQTLALMKNKKSQIIETGQSFMMRKRRN